MCDARKTSEVYNCRLGGRCCRNVHACNCERNDGERFLEEGNAREETDREILNQVSAKPEDKEKNEMVCIQMSPWYVSR